MYETLTRGVAPDDELFGWLQAIYPVYANITAGDVYLSDKVAMAELLLSGCTTAVNHHLVFPNDVALDDGIAAARDIGIR